MDLQAFAYKEVQAAAAAFPLAFDTIRLIVRKDYDMSYRYAICSED